MASQQLYSYLGRAGLWKNVSSKVCCWQLQTTALVITAAPRDPGCITSSMCGSAVDFQCLEAFAFWTEDYTTNNKHPAGHRRLVYSKYARNSHC